MAQFVCYPQIPFLTIDNVQKNAFFYKRFFGNFGSAASYDERDPININPRALGYTPSITNPPYDYVSHTPAHMFFEGLKMAKPGKKGCSVDLRF